MRDIIRSEWTKLRSVRSTWVTALCAVAAGVALSALGATDQLGASASELPEGWDPTAVSLKGFLFAQLIIGMLGVFAMTPEHTTGMIGTSLAIVPSRTRLLAAKTVVVTNVAFVTALVTTLVSFTVVQLLLGSEASAGLGDPGVVGALAAGTAYLTLVALIGLAIGAVARSTTASLAALVGAILLVPAIAPALPGGLGDGFDRLWPINAGQASYAVVPVDDMVAPGVGLGILALAAVAVGIAAHTAFRIRDV